MWQPWASLVAVGAKKIETRGWATKFRGPLAIHAAKRQFGGWDRADREWLLAAAEAFGVDPKRLCRYIDELPRGAIVATCEIVACERVLIHPPADIVRPELLFGNFDSGRYLWRLENVQRVDPPVPAKGMQGMWEWSRAGAAA